MKSASMYRKSFLDLSDRGQRRRIQVETERMLAERKLNNDVITANTPPLSTKSLSEYMLQEVLNRVKSIDDKLDLLIKERRVDEDSPRFTSFIEHLPVLNDDMFMKLEKDMEKDQKNKSMMVPFF